MILDVKRNELFDVIGSEKKLLSKLKIFSTIFKMLLLFILKRNQD